MSLTKPKLKREVGEPYHFDARGWSKISKDLTARLALKGNNVSVFTKNKLPKG